MTEDSRSRKRPLLHAKVSAGLLAVCCLTCMALIALTGCTSASGAGTGTADGSASSTVGARMAGPVVDVNITAEAVASKPKPWVLTTPESAVRSYLDWTSYAYRTAQSYLATATMTPYEGVRVDSYVQLNIQKKRVIDQKLVSITFGTPSTVATTTVIPATEEWTYVYRSIDVGNAVISGPFTAKYDAKYTLVKNASGAWVVDSVQATAQGEVK